jgi:hypothetical protein
VGVKYCFRYSQRNRRRQFAAEEDVDLATLHPFVGLHHPVQRRRREKKLLKIDDVNERFPIMTYKAWRAQRERAGLSAEGGVGTEPLPTVNSPPESRSGTPPLLDSESPVTSQDTPHDISTHNTANDDTLAQSVPTYTPEGSSEIHPQSEKHPEASTITPLSPPTSSKNRNSEQNSDHRNSTLTIEPADEEDSHLPGALLQTTGDNCAICIELLENEDEVRGLTCGHCYHQACIDPWLTQRRASCPLCKADYFIPKPNTERDTDPSANGLTSAGVATEHWAPLLLRPFRPVGYGPGYPPPFGRLDRNNTISTVDTPNTSQAGNTGNSASDGRSGWMGRHIQLRNPFRSRQQVAGTENTLERGEGRV